MLTNDRALRTIDLQLVNAMVRDGIGDAREISAQTGIELLVVKMALLLMSRERIVTFDSDKRSYLPRNNRRAPVWLNQGFVQ